MAHMLLSKFEVESLYTKLHIIIMMTIMIIKRQFISIAVTRRESLQGHRTNS